MGKALAASISSLKVRPGCSVEQNTDTKKKKKYTNKRRTKQWQTKQYRRDDIRNGDRKKRRKITERKKLKTVRR